MDKNPISAVQGIIKDSAGKEVGRIRAGEYKELAPGKYTVTYIPPPGYKIATTNPQTITLKPGDFKTINFGLKPEDIQKVGASTVFAKAVGPPVRTITAGAVTFSLISNPAAITNRFFRPPQPVVTQSRPLNPRQVNAIRSRLSESSAARFRRCVIENAMNLTGIEIPTRSGVRNDLVNFVIEASGDEFLIGALEVYRRSEELRDVLLECDLSLFQDFAEAEEAVEQTTALPYLGNSRDYYQTGTNLEQPQRAVYVDGNRISVRAKPHPNAHIIGYVSYTTMPIDMAVMATLTPQERHAIAVGQGWYPVLLPNDQRGFVHSHYARLIQLNSVPYTASSF